ncbi:MAG: hypothetical protein DRN68_02575 [Thaumarchaeota archaeon]|nr:MAG: hypothetical protein DRN68_02575 [Nitrososphaerota archaeon]
MKISRREFLISASVAVFSASLYSYLETQRILKTKIEVGLGSKIAFMVDTHTHDFGTVEQKIVKILEQENPDIILHGGDIIDKFTVSLKPVRQYLAQLDAKEKYAVLGNHDYWCGRADELVTMLKDLGFTVLKNEIAETGIGRIFGVDWRDDRNYPSNIKGDLILTHDPNAAKFIDEGIILAGHTHGGVVIGGVTILSNSIYTRGLYRLGNDKILYVSRGLGQMIPLRPTSPLELVILE